MAFELTSSAFKQNEAIPKEYTCDGSDMSVPLSWKDAPGRSKSFAIIADDPDAPRGTWVHWVLYDVPADVHEFPAGIGREGIASERCKAGQERLWKDRVRWTVSANRS